MASYLRVDANVLKSGLKVLLDFPCTLIPPPSPTIAAPIHHHTFPAYFVSTPPWSLVILEDPVWHMLLPLSGILFSQTSYKYPFKCHFICRLFFDNLDQWQLLFFSILLIFIGNIFIAYWFFFLSSCYNITKSLETLSILFTAVFPSTNTHGRTIEGVQ